MRQSGPRAASRPSPRAVETPHTVPDLATSWWWVLVLAPMLFNAIWLAPELTSGVPSRNDSALHLLMVHAASDAVRAGSNPFDFWIPQLELGFPQFVYYQHLPHLAVVALHRALLGTVELETVFHIVQYLLLVTFPLTVAWSMRRMGFSMIAAGIGGASASLFSAGQRYGFEYNSYIWRGMGLYTQLWGMHLTFIALASVVRTINEGRGYLRTALVFAALALSHLLYVYMMAVTSVLVLVMGTPWRTQWRMLLPRTARLAVAGGIALAVAAYMVWPFLQSSHAYLSNLPGLVVPYRPVGRLLLTILQGRLLDVDRLPVLSLLAAIGIVSAAVRRGPMRTFALAGFVTWLGLYVGRPLIDTLGNVLPSHAGFVSYRFIGAVALFSILLIGIGGEAIWDAVGRVRMLPPRARPVLALAVLGFLFAPALAERAKYYTGNAQLVADTRAALDSNTELATVLTAISADSAATHYRGRIYAGPRSGWGAQLMVGPSIRVFDVINAHRLPAVGNPFQSLALNSGLLYNFRDGDAGLYDAFDVRTVVTPASASVPSFFQPVLRTTQYAVWRVQTTGLAHYVEVTGRRAARSQRELYVGASDWFVGSAPGAHQVTRWDYLAPSGPFTPVPRCPDGGRTLEEQVGGQHVTVVVECANAGALALKMSYHPNWRVQVDGVPVPTYMVSPSFIGLDLPAGRHRIEARYVATRSKMPLLAFGIVVFVLAAVFRRRLDAPARWIAVRFVPPIGPS